MSFQQVNQHFRKMQPLVFCGETGNEGLHIHSYEQIMLPQGKPSFREKKGEKVPFLPKRLVEQDVCPG